MYPDHRRPTGTLLQQTQTMLSTGSNPTLIANFLHSQQLPVKPRDIYNIKQQLHPSSTPESELQEVLHQPGISSYFSHDENHVLNCISFCTSDQKQLAETFGDVVMMDGTYRINRCRMPLYTLAIVDSSHRGQPIAHGLLAREDIEHITIFLQQAKQWHPSLETAIFIVDKDLAEIAAIRQVTLISSVCLRISVCIWMCSFGCVNGIVELSTCVTVNCFVLYNVWKLNPFANCWNIAAWWQVLPDATIFLCRFHILKAFIEELKHQHLQDDGDLYKVCAVTVSALYLTGLYNTRQHSLHVCIDWWTVYCSC